MAAVALPERKTSFVSVTCTRGDFGLTLQLCARVAELGLEPAAHFLCGGRTRSELADMAASCERDGIRRIVALRGDSRPQPESSRPEDCLAGTHELVALLAERGSFDEIMVGGYPDVHPDAASAKADIDYMARKAGAGATRIITQFCFETDKLCRYRDRLAEAGIRLPLSAGLLPVRNFEGMLRFADRCRATVPDSVRTRFAGAAKDEARRHGIELLAEQTAELIAAGFGIHYYTLNAPRMVAAAWRRATGVQAA